MVNIILCGGNGTRLWPLSRKLMPKQFLKLFDNKSLFQKTVYRNSKICSDNFIITNEEHYFLALEQIEEINFSNYTFLLEPIARNTAPAIALTCFFLDYDDIVLVTPSDHLILNQDIYEKAVNEAKEFAKKDYLVTFGIEPKFPETGYGYIEADGNDVVKFHEKPDLQTAKKYIKSGNFYWNSGIFCFKAGVFLNELKKYAPNVYNQCKIAYENSKSFNDIKKIDINDMSVIEDISIDYAVMEKSNKVKTVPLSSYWNDLGSFDALYSELPKDSNNNSVNSNLISIDSKNNLILGDYRKIATVDIEDLIIVDTPDALLLSKKGSSQKVKSIVKEISKNSNLHAMHTTVHRPWGTYTVLEEGYKFKIKKIVVKPGGSLSLQKHLYRSEHWVVVEGVANVTVEDKKFILKSNESTYIPINHIHRLENKTDKELILIEVQVGEKIDEDDIIRLDDIYKRHI